MNTIRILPSLILFLMALFFYHPSFSQIEWFKNGQVFSYFVRTGFNVSNYGIHSIEVLGDTIIDGINVKKMKYNYITSDPYIFFVYTEGDKAFEYSAYFHTSKLMYDFGLTVGESAPLENFNIIAVGEMQLNNRTHRTQTWNWNDLEVLIIEGIGMVGDPDFASENVCSPFVPQWGCTGYVDGNDYFFRCFTDGNYIFDPYQTCTSSLYEHSFSDNSIVPNPNDGNFTFRNNYSLDEIRLYNSLGRLVMTMKYDEHNQYKITEVLKDGVYFVIGFYNNKKLLIEKMIFIGN